MPLTLCGLRERKPAVTLYLIFLLTVCCVKDDDGQSLQTINSNFPADGKPQLREINNLPRVAQQVSGRAGI